MPEPDPGPRAYAHHLATAHGLHPDAVLLHRDAHGAAHIALSADRDMGIRIQIEPDGYTTPERHAAALERDRQGLLRLAGLATQLAGEIARMQQGAGGPEGRSR